MKTRVTLTIDPEVRHRAKREAAQRNMSLSAMIETLLREATGGPPTAVASRSFSQKWRGRLKLEKQDDHRFAHLTRKYDLK